MSPTSSRREFMAHSLQASAALALMGGAPSAMGAMSAINATATEAVNADLLHALGARIGLEMATAIGSHGVPLSLSYFDAAGPSVDALRDGIEQGVAWHIGAAPACVETPVSRSALLGVALMTNAATGRSARVEIDATALSMIALIESVKTPASAHKHAVLTASADNLYRVEYLL
jgi:hypothetical protein